MAGEDKKQQVGFIGTGIMGLPMVRNLLQAGQAVTVWNRTASKAQPLASDGAVLAGSPLAVAEAADIVLVMLTGPEAIDAVLEGPDGFLGTSVAGKILINLSTVPPGYTFNLSARLAENQVKLLDAPVSGSLKQAEDGSLVILAGGNQTLVKDLTPLLLYMGKKVIYCGAAGQGSAMKMTVNLLLGIMMEGLGEAVNFGQKCGLAMDTILETILAGALDNPLFRIKADMIRQGDYPPQFPLRHMTKDLRFVRQTADEVGTSIPAGDVALSLYAQGMAQGLADADFAAVKKILSELDSDS